MNLLIDSYVVSLSTRPSGRGNIVLRFQSGSEDQLLPNLEPAQIGTIITMLNQPSPRFDTDSKLITCAGSVRSQVPSDNFLAGFVAKVNNVTEDEDIADVSKFQKKKKKTDKD